MDRLLNASNGIHDPTPNPPVSQNCVSSSSSLIDKLLVTTPSWLAVNQDLRWFFMLHSYGFGCLFFILSFCTFFSFLNLRSLISNRPFMSTINIFLCLLGLSRAGCLFIDPYNLKEIMPRVIGSIMWDIGFPFVTSAFCLMQLALLQLTQLKFGLEKFQKETYATLVIISHFSFVIISDVALVFHNHYFTKYIVQIVYLIWGISLFITFLYAGYKVKILLRRLPPNLLIRESSLANQKGPWYYICAKKGIMQLAMLAPYNNLATSVAAALVPTLLGPKFKSDDATVFAKQNNMTAMPKWKDEDKRKQTLLTTSFDVSNETANNSQTISMVPEVFVRPPTPTPSTMNLPSITVSSPSRRSSLTSRRGSDVSQRNFRRASDCSLRFIGEDDRIPENESTQSPNLSDRSDASFKNSNPVSPSGSTKDLRRSSDFTHEKSNKSGFAAKLRRNSDFGNRPPRQIQEEQSRLSKIIDHSPSESRRNSDLGCLLPARPLESRRNSDIAGCSSERQVPDSITELKNLDSPLSKKSALKKSSEDVSNEENKITNLEQQDCIKKSTIKDKNENNKTRKKNLSWKSDTKDQQEEITAETSLLPESQNTDSVLMGNDLSLHSILNHIAYVNRAKNDSPLFIPEVTTAATRRSQIERVLNVAYATAVLGIILCIADLMRIFGPYGLFAEVIKYGTKPLPSQHPKPWPWLAYQSFCRIIELIMGCAMANITKQPSASPRHQYFSNYSSYNLRIKQRENLYI